MFLRVFGLSIGPLRGVTSGSCIEGAQHICVPLDSKTPRHSGRWKFAKHIQIVLSWESVGSQGIGVGIGEAMKQWTDVSFNTMASLSYRYSQISYHFYAQRIACISNRIGNAVIVLPFQKGAHFGSSTYVLRDVLIRFI